MFVAAGALQRRNGEVAVKTLYVHADMGTFRRTPDGMTAAEAINELYKAASTNPSVDDVARLVEAKWTLEAALGIEAGK